MNTPVKAKNPSFLSPVQSPFTGKKKNYKRERSVVIPQMITPLSCNENALLSPMSVKKQ